MEELFFIIIVVIVVISNILELRRKVREKARSQDDLGSEDEPQPVLEEILFGEPQEDDIRQESMMRELEYEEPEPGYEPHVQEKTVYGEYPAELQTEKTEREQQEEQRRDEAEDRIRLLSQLRKQILERNIPEGREKRSEKTGLRRNDLVRAVIWAEVLAPPLAMREPDYLLPYRHYMD